MSRSLRWLSLATIGMMYVVLLGGNLVTKTGSADGCGASWPLCHGNFLPQFNIHSIIEYSHRAVSGITGILVVVMAVWMWRQWGHRSEIRFLAPAAVASVVIQAGLGAWAVMAPQSPLVMALHFGVSLVAFCCVLLPYVLVDDISRGSPYRRQPVAPRFRTYVWALLAYIAVVVYTGAYVRHTGTELACLDWPLCNGSLFPGFSGSVGIQFAHRLAAGIALAAVVVLWAWASRMKERRPDIYRGSVLAAITIVLQVITGGVQVLTRIDLNWTMLHSAVIIVHFAALAYLALQVMPEPEDVPAPRQVSLAGSREALES